ncbi:VWA domain-containing protein [Agaribacterium sp. ZY112]|uniref:VWA domain-containing protein n=1 Tax=Agaribacterium sp. ZY112 TaxID=3233574 RepID=UPI003524113F
MFDIHWPWVFLLLPLPLLAYRYLKPQDRKERSLNAPFFARASAAKPMQSLTGGTARLLSLLLLSGAWFAFIVALSQPVRLGEAQSMSSSGRDLMLAVDISDSMKKNDMPIQTEWFRRIDVAKYILADFLNKREGDRVGLILFGSGAYLQAPLTYDLVTVNTLLQEASLGIAGPKTAIGDAIALAVKQLKDQPESQRVLILLTDGANTSGNIEPEQAAQLAQQAGVTVHTVAVAPYDRFNRRHVDQKSLSDIAEKTGGEYFIAHDPKELMKVYETLNKIEMIDLEEKQVRPIINLFYWPLTISLLLLGLLVSMQTLTAQRS